MKSIRYWTITIMVAAGLWLVACGSNNSPTGSGCNQQQFCVDLEIAGPAQPDQTLTATLTLESQQDLANVQVHVWSSDPTVQFEEPREWWITTTAGATTRLSTTLQLPSQEGAYRVHAGAMLPSGQVIQDTAWMNIAAGNDAAPEIQSSPQIPQLIERVTPTVSPEMRPQSSWPDSAAEDRAQIGDEALDEIVAQGSLHFYDRVNRYSPAVAVRVYLYDDDGAAGPDGSDDRLETTRTDAQGIFTFTSRLNWDADGGSSGKRALDLYVVWETADPVSEQRTTDFDDWSYQFRSETVADAPAGALAFDYYIPNNAQWEPAMWIFQDMIRGWTYVQAAAGGSAGEAAARWEAGATKLSPCDGPCFSPGASVKGIFLDDQGAGSPDIVVHELGHHFLYNAVGSWWQVDPVSMAACTDHGLREAINPMCAWIEGWASFFALAVNGDACFDWESPPCQGLTANLELPTWEMEEWNDGDAVEGRVAGALYDLLDDREDGLDRAAVGFDAIWAIAGDAALETGLAEFWEQWKAGPEDAHLPVQALYQNTINYNTSPLMQLPDCKVIARLAHPHAIDLGTCTTDDESDPSQLEWYIVAVNDWHCSQVGINDQQYVSIYVPDLGWYNTCEVTIRATDGLHSTEDTIKIQVAPIKTRVSLPFVTENH